MSREPAPGPAAHASARATLLGVDLRAAGLVAVLLALAAVGSAVTALRTSATDMGLDGPGTTGLLPHHLGCDAGRDDVPLGRADGRRVCKDHPPSPRVRTPLGATAVFMAGYLLAWTLFGILANAL